MARPSELDDPDRLRALYADASIEAIAKHLEVSPSSVQRALVRNNIDRRGTAETARKRIVHPKLADAEQLAERYATASMREIAEEVGVNPKTVRRALILHGIALHSKPSIPRSERPAVLDDPQWLAKRYERAWSVKEIATELHIDPQMVNAALRRHKIAVRSERGSQHPRLVDPAWLRSRIAHADTASIALELGVSRVGVQRALDRYGIGSPYRYDSNRLPRPDPKLLHRSWNLHETIKGVGLELGVSPTTAKMWLAEAGIFVTSTPSISRTDLARHVAADDSIAEICRQHRVTGSTVIVELHRHGLFTAHRRRHLRRKRNS